MTPGHRPNLHVAEKWGRVKAIADATLKDLSPQAHEGEHPDAGRACVPSDQGALRVSQGALPKI
jgi:hypothetical protein